MNSTTSNDTANNITPMNNSVSLSARKPSVVMSIGSRSTRSSIDNSSFGCDFRRDSSTNSHRFRTLGKKIGKMATIAKSFSLVDSVIEMKNESETYPDDFIRRIDETDLPNFPRFPATMSSESQYCFLKGYEDLIEQELNKNKLHSERKLHSHESLSKYKLIHDPELNMRLDYAYFLPYSPITKSGEIDPATPSAIQQITTTYRLQNAIDILDCINQKNSKYTFSNRHEKHLIDPESHFQNWKQVWINDFEVKLL